MLVKQISENIDTLVEEIMEAFKASRARRNLVRLSRPYEAKFEKVLKGLFRGQEREVLANMSKHPHPDRKAQIDPYMEVTKQNWLSDWLFAEMMWRKRFEKDGKPFIGGVMETVGQAEMTNLVVGIDFDVSNPRVQAFLGDKLAKYSEKVTTTTLEKLRKALKAGVKLGEGIPDLSKRVNKVFGFAEKYRATVIARTEVLSSANKATLEAYRQSGVVARKEWLTAGDERVRPSHSAANGQKVALDKMFTLGSGVRTDGPGQSGVAAEDIDCRCTTTAIVKR